MFTQRAILSIQRSSNKQLIRLIIIVLASEYTDKPSLLQADILRKKKVSKIGKVCKRKPNMGWLFQNSATRKTVWLLLPPVI